MFLLLSEERGRQYHMSLQLTPNEVIYEFNAPSLGQKSRANYNPAYNEVFKRIKMAMEIKDLGYNVYLIDNYSKEKVEGLKGYIKDILKKRKNPKDICYVVYEDEKSPKALFLVNGNGMKLKKALEDMQNDYAEAAFQFYNNTNNKEKEDLLQDIQKKRTELVTNLVEISKKEGFDVKATGSGFMFIPLKNGSAMTEREYDELEISEKEKMLSKVSILKSDAQDILDNLKGMETESIDKIKVIMEAYFESEREKLKEKYLEVFSDDQIACEYLRFVCDNIEKALIENYSTSYEEDEEKINESIYKYVINVIVDNSENTEPLVIYEEDPNVINLLGSTEYENHNGTYVTDISLIQGGSLLKANEGCIIIRANNLLTNSGAYYHLKKSLLSEKIKFDYNKGYLELLSMSGLKPAPIDINVKVILMGDYEIYDALYHYDEDFKNLFKIRAEYSQIVDSTEENNSILIGNIDKIVSENDLKPLTDEAVKEVAKYFSRSANDKRKFVFDEIELKKILAQANYKVECEERKNIEGKDIIDVGYSQELIENEILDNYKENKIILNTEGETVGSINGLSVIDVGYFSFGKPLRITCNCYKGSGSIIDVQKESSLSGQIHNKSINILRGYLTTLLGSYNSIHVDFHISFEQLYGKIEGDSASVAEVVCMISALSKVPVKQNIAVTGSINQFGEVQAIGGVNEKIEGFFNVCKLKGGIKDNGVLIPYANKDELILKPEVEEAVKEGKFKIFVMKNVEDAVTVLMGNENYNYEEILNTAQNELKKYHHKEKQ
jgi:predicted ATP-dependent protease